MDKLAQNATLEKPDETIGKEIFDAVANVVLCLHKVKTALEAHEILISKISKSPELKPIFANVAYTRLLGLNQLPLLNKGIGIALDTIEFNEDLSKYLPDSEWDALNEELIYFVETIEDIQVLLRENVEYAATPEKSKKGTPCKSHSGCTKKAIEKITDAITEGAELLSKLAEENESLEYPILELDENIKTAQDKIVDRMALALA